MEGNLNGIGKLDSDAIDAASQLDYDWQVETYFRQVTASLPKASGHFSVCVVHMLPDALQFLEAVDRIAPIGLVLEKPNSVVAESHKLALRRFPKRVKTLSRTWAEDAARVIKTLNAAGLPDEKIILIDIGGYFAPSIRDLVKKYKGTIAGVLEGTANGFERYRDEIRANGELGIPILTVANSPLKGPENHLIGASVAFSIEAVFRDHGQVLQSHDACVLGFGRVGRSVASALRGRGVPTRVYDTNAVALAEAAAQGYAVSRDLKKALARTTLVVSATGHKALTKEGFAALANGAFVATVTSADDELDMSALSRGYFHREVSSSLDWYGKGSRGFFLMHKGNAINFLHSAVVGPAIQLLEGEKLACIAHIGQAKTTGSGISEASAAQRDEIANIWLRHFIESPSY